MHNEFFHCLDNRKGVTGLKFQTYVNFGITDYDSDIHKFLSATDEYLGANSINKIEDFISQYGVHSLLDYNGMDSTVGLELARKHIKALRL